MNTVSEYRKRAAQAAADAQDASPTPEPEPAEGDTKPGETTYVDIIPGVRDATCGACGTVFAQQNLALARLTQALGVPGFCTSSSEPIREANVFEDRWIPSCCPNCERLERERTEELRRAGFYDQSIRQSLAVVDEVVDAEGRVLAEALQVAFDEGEAVLVVDSVSEVSADELAKLRAGGCHLAIGGNLAELMP